MTTIGAYEAKTHLSELLKRVEKGETITITRHGIAIALLTPVDSTNREAVRETIKEIQDFRIR